MTTTKTDELVRDYLDRLQIALRPLPPSRRDQLVSEITEHIQQGRAGGKGQSETAVRELLDRLGEPEDIAEAALIDEPADGPRRRRTGGFLIGLALLVLLVAAVTTAGLLGAFTSGGGGTNHKQTTPPTLSTLPKGPRVVTVPNVLGMTVAAARSTLSSAGLGVMRTVLKPSNSVPPGQIFSQSPVAGSRVATISNVDLTESSGPTGQSG
jgi:hypothetical protein